MADVDYFIARKRLLEEGTAVPVRPMQVFGEGEEEGAGKEIPAEDEFATHINR
jgi:hypothetical protein